MERTDERHLTRLEIIKAAREGVAPEHLKRCSDCRLLYETLVRFTAGANDLPEVPAERLIDKLSAIPVLVGRPERPQQVRGSRVYDSWFDSPAVGLRDHSLKSERRLRFEYGTIGLELVAERHGDHWEFSARVYEGTEVTCKYVLKVGRQKLSPQEHDCYFFQRPTLPTGLNLLSPRLDISFDLAGPFAEAQQ